jgi:CheY-like chemotaxis protein
MARELHPRLVLCDLTLGQEMSGYEVARALRAEDALAETALVAVTGRQAEDCRADATAAGFDAIITKPVDLDALEALVRHPPRHAPIRAAADPEQATEVR